MLCLRCIRSALPAVNQIPRQTTTIGQKVPSQVLQRRTFGVLSSLPSRPTAIPSRASLPATSVECTTLQPTSQPSLSVMQVRGGKRDTFNPSHVVRKRRHGFLSRLRSRTGRMILQRRKLKRRTTLSH